MPSVAVTMGVATQTLVTEKLNAKIKPSAIFIDNALAGADASLIFNDVFTPSITNLVPGPVLTTVPRLYLNVVAGSCVSLEDAIKNCEFLGNVQIIRSVADAGCRVSFIYDLE
jgi:hypothetical protein